MMRSCPLARLRRTSATRSIFVCRYVISSRQTGRQTRARIPNAQRQNCQRAGQLASAASMQTAAKLVSGRKDQTCVGILARRKKMRKQISAPIKAVPAKKAAVSASSCAASGKTRITQRAIARIASEIHSQRNQASVGAIASERFVHINGDRKPICDNTGAERWKNQPFNHTAPSTNRPTIKPITRNAGSAPPTVKDQVRSRAGNRIGQDS